MPTYAQAPPFDLVRTIKSHGDAIKKLQVTSPAQIRQSLNQTLGSLNANPYFWGGDTTGWSGGANGTFSVVSNPPTSASYPYAGLFTIVNSGVSAALTGQQFSVIPLQQLVVTATIWTPTTTCVLGFTWFDSTHTQIGSPSTTSLAVSANTWVPVQAVASAPAGAAYAYVTIAPADGVGNYIYVQAVITQLSTVAFQPGSNPPTVESWHAVTLPSTGGFSGTIRVKMSPIPNFAILDVQVRWTGTTGTTYSAGSLPTGYYPTTGTPRFYNLSYGDSPNTDSLGSINIPASGALQIFTAQSGSGSGTGGWYGNTILYPLD